MRPTCISSISGTTERPLSRMGWGGGGALRPRASLQQRARTMTATDRPRWDPDCEQVTLFSQSHVKGGGTSQEP